MSGPRAKVNYCKSSYPQPIPEISNFLIPFGIEFAERQPAPRYFGYSHGVAYKHTITSNDKKAMTSLALFPSTQRYLACRIW